MRQYTLLKLMIDNYVYYGLVENKHGRFNVGTYSVYGFYNIAEFKSYNDAENYLFDLM